MDKIIDKSKTVVTSVIIISLTVFALGVAYLFASFKTKEVELDFKLREEEIKLKEAEINEVTTKVYDKFNHCLSIAMDKSKQNGSPCSIQDAEKACSKFHRDSPKKTGGPQ